MFISCGVNVDLSKLEFVRAESGDVRSGVDVAKPVDVPGTDNARSDSSEEPDAEASASCWEVYSCLMQEEMSWDLNQSSFLKCGAILENGEFAEPIQDLHDCLDVCVISDTADEFGACLFANCIDDTLRCVNDMGGEKSCAEAMMCSASDCTAFQADPSINDAYCLLDCFSGLDEEELDKLASVIDECFESDGEMNASCVPAIQYCYAGSGSADKSCQDVLTCQQQCEPCDEDNPDGGEECSGSCFFECYEDISWDAHDQISGLTLCYIDEAADPFVCLNYSLQCFEESLGAQPGTTTCAQTLQTIKGHYYAGDNVHFAEKFGAMLGTFWALNKEYISTMYMTLECLSEKWGVFPGYGAMGNQHWKECAEICP